MDIFKLDQDKNNHSFNTYLLYEEGKFVKNQRQDFVNRIKKNLMLKMKKSHTADVILLVILP